MSMPAGSCCGNAAGEVANRIAHRRGTPPSCQACGTTGSVVERRTLLHMLRQDRIERLGERDYRYCETAECDTVYFSTDGEAVFTTADLRERVGTKMGVGPSAPVCYCFGFTVGDVEAEIEACGSTEIPSRIRELVKARMCACEVRNPSGRCCLGEIARVVTRLAQPEQRRGGRSIDEEARAGFLKEDV